VWRANKRSIAKALKVFAPHDHSVKVVAEDGLEAVRTDRLVLQQIRQI
jgi:hypothetical protein